MTAPGSDNAQRAETEQRPVAAQVSNHPVGNATRSLAGVVLAVAVAAALLVLSILVPFGYVHSPLGVVNVRGFEQRPGVELVVVPLGVIAGALLWQRFGVTTAMSRNRIIGPWLPPLGVCLIIGASLLLISSWRGDYPWYGPTRLLLAAALACGAFVIGRFYPPTSAILAGAIGTPALFAVAVLAFPQLLVDPMNSFEDRARQSALIGAALAGSVAMMLASIPIRTQSIRFAIWSGAIALFLAVVGYISGHNWQ